MRAGQCVPHSIPKRILGQLGEEEIRGEKMASGWGPRDPQRNKRLSGSGEEQGDSGQLSLTSESLSGVLMRPH